MYFQIQDLIYFLRFLHFSLADIFKIHMSTMRSLNKPHFKLQNHLLSFITGTGHAKFGFKTIICKPNEIQNSENVKYILSEAEKWQVQLPKQNVWIDPNA